MVAIENHLKFSEWLAALDRLTTTKDTLQTAVVFNGGPGIIDAARTALLLAQAQFNKISDEID